MPNAWKALFQTCTVQDLQEVLKPTEEGLIYQLPSDHFNEVYPGILLGDAVTALNRERLLSLGVTHVVNAAQAPSLSRAAAPQQEGTFCNWGVCGGFIRTSDVYYKESGIKFMGIPATDTSDFQLFPYFYEAADFIDTALASKGRVMSPMDARLLTMMRIPTSGDWMS